MGCWKDNIQSFVESYHLNILRFILGYWLGSNWKACFWNGIKSSISGWTSLLLPNAISIVFCYWIRTRRWLDVPHAGKCFIHFGTLCMNHFFYQNLLLISSYHISFKYPLSGLNINKFYGKILFFNQHQNSLRSTPTQTSKTTLFVCLCLFFKCNHKLPFSIFSAKDDFPKSMPGFILQKYLLL